MRTLLTILAMLVLPSAAVAQVQPVNRGPMTPYLPSNTRPDGITVSGSATKKVAATSAKITLYLYSFAIPPKAGAPPGTPPPLDPAKVQSVIEAVVKAGVPRENIATPQPLGASQFNNNTQIVATVANPTVAQIQNGIAILGAALVGMTGMSMNAQVFLESSTCGEAGDSLRGAAIASAHAKAASIAKQLGVHLGSVLNVVASDQQPPNGICTWQYQMGNGNMPQFNSPDDWVSVPVYSNVTITYAIKN